MFTDEQDAQYARIENLFDEIYTIGSSFDLEVLNEFIDWAEKTIGSSDGPAGKRSDRLYKALIRDFKYNMKHRGKWGLR